MKRITKLLKHSLSAWHDQILTLYIGVQLQALDSFIFHAAIRLWIVLYVFHLKIISTLEILLAQLYKNEYSMNILLAIAFFFFF